VLAAGIFRLPWRNPGFWALTGTLQIAMTLAVLLGLAGTGGLIRQLAGWAPAVLVAIVLLLGGVAFARFNRPANPTPNTVAGVLHALGHVALSVGWALLVFWLDRTVLPAVAILAVVAIGTPVVIGFLDAELVAVYLLVASRFGINLNEVFAGQSIEDDKGFLRMHIGADGTLTVYPLKLPTVCRRWRVDPDGAPGDPWLRPDGTRLSPELIEPPITIPRVSS
jgi:hypothetical protein